MKPNIIVPDSDNISFPVPPSTEEIWETTPDDYISCLHNAIKYEKLEERARACGLTELADEYETVKNTWYEMYEYSEYGTSDGGEM
jgi:hypothetical protein